MKKTIMLIALVCMTMAAQAQLGVKRVAKFSKGDKAVYRTEQTMNVAGQDIKVTSTEQYVVTDATADGFVIENTTKEVNSDVVEGDIVGTIMKTVAEMGKDLVIRFKTDKEGKPTSILNADEVTKKMEATADKFINEIFAKNPEIEPMLPKETLKEQFTDQFSAENMLKSYCEGGSVFALNGKTIMTGSMDEYVNDDDMKIKRMYFLTEKDASKVKVTGNLSMNKEELKAMALAKLEESMPAEQIEAVKQNIDQVMENMKMDVKETTDYEFFPNGWLKTLTNEVKSDAMGQTSSNSKKIECIEHSWK